ncbi:hypothetical protein MKY89_30495 [Bacillus sp. FSL W7-1294]|uniref:hypothetical protein n=1 Tax=Bacillus sp. FSL W7-1294 TaxID=2921595 RepID=UPI0030F62E49
MKKRTPEFVTGLIGGVLWVTIHTHQLKAEYKTKFCLFELKSPQMEGFIKNKHAK